MEHNNKLRRTLREERPLPSELGWEQMQEGIFEQMGESERDRRGLFFFIHWKKILAAALLVLNFSVMAYLFYLVQKKEQIGAFPIPIEYQTSVTTENQKQTTTTKLEEPNLTSSENGQTTTPISRNSPSLTEQVIQVINIKNILNYSSKKSPDEKITLYDNIEHRIYTNEQEDVRIKNINSEESASIHRFNALDNLISPIAMLEQKNPELEHTLAELKIERAPFKPYYVLEIGGGVNSWSSNYNTTSTEQNLREDSETELWGYQLEANVKYYFQPNWYATTGFGFQQLNNRFNYENTRIDQVEARSVLVGIAINSISGDSTFIRQDIMVDVEEKRKVQHYNRHQILTIPLRLGYEWRQDRLALSGSIGSVFSIQSFSKGKTLVGSEIETYNRENPIYKKRFGMGVSANLQLNYALNSDIYIGGTVGYTNWLSNWSEEQDVQLRPNIGQFSILLGKKF